MTELDKIMELLTEAKRRAEAAGDQHLAYHIGTALLVAAERSLGQQPSKGRK